MVKRMAILCIAIMPLLASCNDNSCKENNIIKPDYSDSLIHLLKYHEYVFVIDTANPIQFGYYDFEDDEDMGIKSISIGNDYIYLTDVFYSNIKKVSINNGKIETVSPKLGNKKPYPAWLMDIAFFHDYVYVTSKLDSIYVLSSSLIPKKSISCDKGVKTIDHISNDSLLIYLSDKQLPNKSVEYSFLLIKKNGDYSTINKNISIEEESKSSLENQTMGKHYELYKDLTGTEYIKTEYGKLKLNTPIPQLTEYSARNLDFNEHYLVYFDCNPKKLTLYIYEY
jgi:hypothetical protein